MRTTHPIIDPIAVERAVAGDGDVHLYPRERDEAVRRLTLRGLSESQIADRLTVTRRTVTRCKARLRERGLLAEVAA